MTLTRSIDHNLRNQLFAKKPHGSAPTLPDIPIARRLRAERMLACQRWFQPVNATAALIE